MNISDDYKWVRRERFISIDPGVNTGWALFTGESIPENTGVFRTDPDDKTTTEKLFTLKTCFNNLLDSLDPDILVIEDCEYRSSHKGIVSAGSGALSLLSKIVGGYAMLSRCPVILVPAMAWKGNLPEKAVRRRVVTATNTQYREHEQEAVGIGLSIFGNF